MKIRRNVICESCGIFEVEYETLEELRDEIALHIMLAHNEIAWSEEGLSDGNSNSQS